MSDLNLLDEDAVADWCGVEGDDGARAAIVADVIRVLQQHTVEEKLQRDLSAKSQRDASIDLRKDLARALESVRRFRPEFARAVGGVDALPLERELSETIARLDEVIVTLPTKAPTKTEDLALKSAMTEAARVFQRRSRWKQRPTLPQYRERLMEFVKATGLVRDAGEMAEIYAAAGVKKLPNRVLLRRLKRMIPSDLLQPGPSVRRAR